MKVTIKDYFSAVEKIKDSLLRVKSDIPNGIKLTDKELAAFITCSQDRNRYDSDRCTFDADKEIEVSDDLVNLPVPIFLHVFSDSYMTSGEAEGQSWDHGYTEGYPLEKFFKSTEKS